MLAQEVLNRACSQMPHRFVIAEAKHSFDEAPL